MIHPITDAANDRPPRAAMLRPYDRPETTSGDRRERPAENDERVAWPACDHAPMPGLLCLQGGREFTPECLDMDRYVVDRSGATRVAILAGAARVGADYDSASQRARHHYESLGVDVVIIADPRSDEPAALDELTDEVGLVVLPGGSPSSLLDVLRGAIRQRLHHLQHEGVAISGASAGAMVLCQRMVSPDQDGAIVEAMGLVEGLALPHWSPAHWSPARTTTAAPGTSSGWTVPDELTLWGLPECGGVVIDGTSCVAVGQGEPSLRAGNAWTVIERRG